MSAAAIQCPICSNSFDSSKINQHVESCLSKEDQYSATKKSKPEKPIENSAFASQSSRPLGQKSRGLAKTFTPKSSESDCVREKEALSEERDIDFKMPKESLFSKMEPCKPDKNQTNTSMKKSLSDVLGKRSQPAHKDPTPDSRKRPRLSPTSSSKSENISSNLISCSQTVPKTKTPEVKKENLDKMGKNLKSSKEGLNEVDLSKGIPLAEQLRPTCFEEYFGQNEVVGDKSSIRLLLQSNKIPSMILWGPPGCGKTSLVNIITSHCKKSQQKRVVKLSATTSGINDVKEAVKVAKNELAMFKRETLMFIDEIHRFNKLQQDFFLPYVENGTITLIGATTENPSFHVNNALLSRCKVLVLNKHSFESISKILERAVERMGGACGCDMNGSKTFTIEKNAIEMLANLCDGDARSALNALEMAVNTVKNQRDCMITTNQIKDVMQRNRVLYDKNGEEHYNIISAMHKSIRGSDENAALYWLARMLEGGENPLYVARRLVRIASEDIGLADSTALTKATAAYQSCHLIGMPECDVILAQVVVYLARAPKSVEVYKAYNAAKTLVKNWKGPLPGVPLHLRNAPTKLMKELNYGKGYKYNPDFEGPVEQDYLPLELKGTDFFSTK